MRTGDLGCGLRGETDLENDLDLDDDLKYIKKMKINNIPFLI